MIKLCAFSDEAADSLEGQIEALLRNGIYMTELRNVNSKNVAGLTLEEAGDIYSRLTSAGIKIWSVGSPLGKVDIDCNFDEYMNKVRHVFSLAKIFHTKNIRIFSFFNAYEKGERVIGYLNKMADEAKKQGLNLCHENEKEVYGDTADRVDELSRKVDGLKLIFDPANYLQCGENAAAAYERFKDRTYYYHIKDVDKTGAVVPAGTGGGGIARIIKELDASKQTVLTLEPHLALFSGYAAIDNTELKNAITFKNNAEAFDYAAKTLIGLIEQAGYKYNKEGEYIK